MASLGVRELRTNTKEELQSLVAAERARLLELRMRMKNTPLKNVKEIKEIRKNIARILTIIRERK